VHPASGVRQPAAGADTATPTAMAAMEVQCQAFSSCSGRKLFSAQVLNQSRYETCHISLFFASNLMEFLC
jgi:hypothetical protein